MFKVARQAGGNLGTIVLVVSMEIMGPGGKLVLLHGRFMYHMPCFFNFDFFVLYLTLS
jgi:hypothetical protein